MQVANNNTIVALATPPGEGALAIIRLSGPQSFGIVDKLFIGADLTTCKSHTIHFGHIQGADGDVIDEVLVFIFKAPATYTGEDVIEISCHGSTYIIQRILERCTSLGAKMAAPGEFTQRAFLNGKMDLTQAEAVSDLISSKSAAAHKIALQQMRGGFSNEIKILRERLIHFASLMELELDFAEEDVEFANRKDLDSLITEILVTINKLITSFKLGNVLKEGINTVIAGRPNAGKSTLLNKLLDESRAIVSEIPGTTRDTIEEVLNINGIHFRLIDTAGIRDARDQIEAIGIGKTLEKIKQAAIVLYIFDVAKNGHKELQQDLEALDNDECTLLVVGNKMDLNPYAKAEEFAGPHLRHDQFVPVSAINRMNIGYLKERLYAAALGGRTNLESTIVSNARHVTALEATRQNLLKVQEGFIQKVTSDFIAMDIRQAIYHLGEITGEISSDDLLDNIFRNFCIGK